MSKWRDTSSFNSPRWTAYDVNQFIFNGGRDLSRTNLMGLDLNDIQGSLSGFNLTEACLIGITGYQCDFIETNFRGADLRNADLTFANLSGANFERAEMTGANLRGADLTRANFEDARMYGVNFAFAKLRDAKYIDPPFWSSGIGRTDMLLWQTILPDGTLFPGPFLTTGYTEDFPKEFW